MISPMITIANLLVGLATLYLALGLVLVAPIVLRGVNRINPVAHESSWGFRLIIIPGVIALWPILVRRWIAGRTAPPTMIRPLRKRHRAMIVTIAVAVPTLFAAGLASRSPIPRAASLSSELGGHPSLVRSGTGSETVWEGEAVVMTPASVNGRPGWLIEKPEDLQYPDLLVYHLPPGVELTRDGLPGEAVLLGKLAGKRSVVQQPSGSGVQGSRLVLYSLGHQQVVATVRLGQTR